MCAQFRRLAGVKAAVDEWLTVARIEDRLKFRCVTHSGTVWDSGITSPPLSIGPQAPSLLVPARNTLLTGRFPPHGAEWRLVVRSRDQNGESIFEYDDQLYLR